MMAALCQTLRQTVAALVLFFFFFFVLIVLLEVFHSRRCQVVQPALSFWENSTLVEGLYCITHRKFRPSISKGGSKLVQQTFQSSFQVEIRVVRIDSIKVLICLITQWTGILYLKYQYQQHAIETESSMEVVVICLFHCWLVLMVTDV